MSPPQPPSPASPTSPAAAPNTDARLGHLFRDSLRQGRIHPLYPPMVRYRQSRSGER